MGKSALGCRVLAAGEGELDFIRNREFELQYYCVFNCDETHVRSIGLTVPKVYNSVAFSLFTGLWHHHHDLVPGHFHPPKGDVTPLSRKSSPLPFPSPWQSLIRFVSLWNF